MARSVDFYRPPILPDPSLRLLDQRGIWAFGGIAVLGAILLLGALLRLDQLDRDLLTPTEAAIWRDWHRSSHDLVTFERRELLAPLYHGTLRLWGYVGSSIGMLRLHSALWALVLAAVVFRIGTVYFSPQVGALAALLLAVSPLLVEVSHRIGAATEASVFLLLNCTCLVGAVFHRASRGRWTLYLLTALLAIACHPLSLWVILVLAVVAFVRGPIEEQHGFYGHLAGYVILTAVVGWFWFHFTRPIDSLWQPDWGIPTRPGWLEVAHLLGACAFWGTRIYPTTWIWTAASAVAVVLPLLYGGFAIRQRRTQELNSFLLVGGVVPPLLILLAPRRFIETHFSAAEVLTLTIAPLALWAASSILLGLRSFSRRGLAIALVGGGILVTLWSSRVPDTPAWEDYRTRLQAELHRGRTVVCNQVAPLADYEHYLGSDVKLNPLDSVLGLARSSQNTLLVFEPHSGPASRYLAADPDNSPAPLIRDWLKKKCSRQDLLHDRFFHLWLWKDFDPMALRAAINRQTFHDPAAWDALRFVDWFGPYDPGFERLGTTSRVFQQPVTRQISRVLTRSRAQWVFDPQQPPGYYHIFIPLRLLNVRDKERPTVVWTLPSGQRKRPALAADTEGFSFIWEPVVPGEALKIGLFAPGAAWQAPRDGDPNSVPPVLFHGVGVRRHFPYVVDVGAPFDDLALGSGWHEAEREGDVNFRWTKSLAELAFYLPVVGGINLEGQISLRVAQRHPDGQLAVPFEVEWDGQRLTGPCVATREWTNVRLRLPERPEPGRHLVLIRSPSFRVAEPDDPERHKRLGLMVDSVTVK